MARRLPSQPPTLPGFSHLHVLGAGGFADVFLYEQNMPRRQVAVKVMLSEVVNDQVRQMFQAEANLMAQLSAHPSILTVYQASVSSDGRPYLVMELCSSALSQRYRAERLPVSEVLRIAVKIGSAIETAHRAGVLHRDIKPSNILLTAYGHPVLSDFGIASTLSGSGPDEGAVVGMSIPWSAPEVLMDETAGTIESEVWSLAATVYSFLAGRSPFEVPGDSNRSTDLISRINRAKPQPIGRDDVPASLESALAKAMARKPENRQASVLELVRELQAVETELGFAQTQVEVAMDDWALATVADLEDRTRVRGVSGAVTAVSSNRRRRRVAAVQGEYSPVGTLLKQSNNAAGSPRSTSTSPLQRGRGMQILSWVLVGVAALTIALAAVVTLSLIQSDSDEVAIVSDIEATVEGSDVAFSWADPGISETANYQVQINDVTVSVQTSESFQYQANAGERVCIKVTVNDGGQLGTPSSPKCVDVTG